MITKKESLQQLIDIKEFNSLRGKALAHISSKQFQVYSDWQKWKQKTPFLGLEQEHIDSVIAGQEREAEMLEYIYNLILNDDYDS